GGRLLAIFRMRRLRMGPICSITSACSSRVGGSLGHGPAPARSSPPGRGRPTARPQERQRGARSSPRWLSEIGAPSLPSEGLLPCRRLHLHPGRESRPLHGGEVFELLLRHARLGRLAGPLPRQLGAHELLLDLGLGWHPPPPGALYQC